jgi:hypothetical protein
MPFIGSSSPHPRTQGRNRQPVLLVHISWTTADESPVPRGSDRRCTTPRRSSDPPPPPWVARKPVLRRLGIGRREERQGERGTRPRLTQDVDDPPVSAELAQLQILHPAGRDDLGRGGSEEQIQNSDTTVLMFGRDAATAPGYSPVKELRCTYLLQEPGAGWKITEETLRQLRMERPLHPSRIAGIPALDVVQGRLVNCLLLPILCDARHRRSPTRTLHKTFLARKARERLTSSSSAPATRKVTTAIPLTETDDRADPSTRRGSGTTTSCVGRAGHRRCRLRGRHPRPAWPCPTTTASRSTRPRSSAGADTAGVCRGNFCRVRRLIADTQRSTLEQHSLRSKATNVKGSQPSEGDCETGGGPTCLTRRT